MSDGVDDYDGERRPGGLPSLLELHQRVAAAEEEDLIETVERDWHREFVDWLYGDFALDGHVEVPEAQPEVPWEQAPPVPLGKAMGIVEHLLGATPVESVDED